MFLGKCLASSLNFKKFYQNDQKHYAWVSPSRQHAQRKTQALHYQLGKQVFLKENGKNIRVKEIGKILEIYGWILSPTNIYYLKVTSYIKWQSIKQAILVKLDQIYQICFFASSLRNQQNCRFSYFWQHLVAWSASTLWHNVVKHDTHRKIFVAESVHIAI